MQPKITFDRTIVTVLNDAIVHLLVELTAPPAPDTDRPPLDVVLVLDKSGSMNGAPIESVKAAVAHFLRLVGANDRVGVVAFDELNCPEFAGETSALLESLDLSQLDLRRLPFDPYISWFVRS